LQRALEGPRIEHEQQVALLDGLAVLEVELGEVARYAGAYLHRLDCFEAAGVLVPLDDLALQRLAHRYARECRSLLGLRLGGATLVAPAPHRRQGDGGNQHAGSAAVTPASTHARTHHGSRRPRDRYITRAGSESRH